MFAMKRKKQDVGREVVVAKYHGGTIFRRGENAYRARVFLLSMETGKKTDKRTYSAKSQSECEAWIDEVQGGQERLTPRQYAAAVEAFRLLGDRPLVSTIEEVLEAYKHLRGQPLLGIIDLGMKASSGTPQKVAKAAAAYLEYVRTREEKNDLRKKTADEYRRYLKRFVEAHGEHWVHSITAQAVIDFMDANWPNRPTSQLNAYRSIRAFYSYALAEDWVPRDRDPFASGVLMRFRESLTKAQKSGMQEDGILYFKPKECARLLWESFKTDRPMFPYLLVRLFLGVRTEEANRLTGADFHLDRNEEHPRLEISEKVSKTRQRRTIDLSLPVFRNVLDFLRTYVRLQPAQRLAPWNGANVMGAHLTKLCARAGLSDKRQYLPEGKKTKGQDILRHTTSTFLARLVSEAEYMDVMGHSVSVRKKFYDATTVKTEAEEFYYSISKKTLRDMAKMPDAKSSDELDEEERRRMETAFEQMAKEEPNRWDDAIMEAEAVLDRTDASKEEKAEARRRLEEIAKEKQVVLDGLDPEDVGWPSVPRGGGAKQGRKKPEKKDKNKDKPKLSRKEFLRTAVPAEPSKR